MNHVVAPVGGFGNHIRWLMLLDPQFDVDFMGNDKFEFIQQYIYPQSRTWHNWLSVESKYRFDLNSVIGFDHSYPKQFEHNDRALVITIDPNLSYTCYLKLNSILNNASSLGFKGMVANSNVDLVNWARKNPTQVLVLDGKVLYNSVLDRKFYQQLIDCFGLKDQYELAAQVHKIWFELHEKAPHEMIAHLQKIYGGRMRKLWYMGLEPYKARYTLQLQQWNEAVFKRRGINYEIVSGETLSNDQAIVTGQVLDAHGRTYFGMSQLMNLVKRMKAGEVNNEDVVYFEDMFQPGIESLPYILNQIDPAHRPRIYVRCLAQTIDPDDFVHVWGMSKWMGLYEKMVDSFVDGVLATNEEMVAHMKIAGWEAPIYNISGLAFGKEEVRSRVNEIKPFEQRKMRVGFAARFDQEKQPAFFMDLVRRYKHIDPSVEFAVFAGASLKAIVQSTLQKLAN
jgi:hypothetical protein